jgi:hypothetical protein
MFQVVNILLSDFSIFVATIFKGIIVSSIFLSQNISLNFASIFFHFKRPVFKSKSAKDKKFIEFQISFISSLLFQIAINAQINAHIEVQDISSISIFFSSKYFKTHICANHLAAPHHKAKQYFFIL